MCIFYMLLKCVSHGEKESFDRGVGGWGELYIIFLEFFNFANHHTKYICDKLFYNGDDSR